MSSIRWIHLIGAALLVAGARFARFDHVVRGTVKAEDGRPIEAAEVTTDLPDERAVTGSDGAFLLSTKSPGLNVVLHAKAVGFSPGTQSVSFESADTAVISFSLKRVAQKLPSLEVTGTPSYTSAKMMAFEERRKAGIGRFITREMLAQRENSVLTDVLRMTPGLIFVRRPDKCGGGFAMASTRGGSVNRQDWMWCEGYPPPSGIPFAVACYLAIYLDGVRIWAPGQKEPPNIDNVASIVSLEAIEIYRGPSETPIMYQNTGSSCGTVLLWTRTGEKG
jgi:hypothetical protein